MDKNKYLTDVYAKYWIDAREKIYGFMPYDKALCEYISNNVLIPGKLLEVAIGTGYPFAQFFNEKGYKVFGIDISPDLINKCSQLYPDIDCKVGCAEELPYPENFFDCVYCFHSTWYFSDLIKAISQMIRVVRPGGIVIFDIENRNNIKIERAYRKHVFLNQGIGKLFKLFTNIAKVILHRGTPDWSYAIYEVPTFPEDILKYLLTVQIRDHIVMVRKDDQSIEAIDVNNSSLLAKSDRVIFSIKK